MALLFGIVVVTAGGGATFFFMQGLSYWPNLLMFSFFVADGGYLLFVGLRQVSRVRNSGWYRAKIKITPQTIEWSVPFREPIIGHWDRLQFINQSRRLLYFSDGKTIRLAFGPDLIASLAEDDLDRIVTTGQSRLLAAAFEAYTQANIETRSTWYPSKRYHELWKIARSYQPPRGWRDLFDS